MKKIDYLKRTSPADRFAMIFLAILILACLLAPFLPIDPTATDVTAMSQGPSTNHWFGTDQVGRDYLIRVLYGGRVSLLVGVLAMLAATFIGTVVGLTAAYFGGWIDNLLMRLVDVLSSIPWMILVIVMNVFLKPGLTTIILVIGCFSWMEISRLIRGEALSIKERDYVGYAQFLGENPAYIMWRHIFPSIFPTLIVAATSSMANAIMTESALSFLGMGIQQPMSSWGSLLQDGQSNLQSMPYMAILPGLFVLLTVYSFNRIGDIVKRLIGRELD